MPSPRQIMMTSGLALVASSHARSLVENLICLSSPTFVFWLLTRVSGIPLLRKRNLKRWGHDASFIEYVETTPMIIPYFF